MERIQASSEESKPHNEIKSEQKISNKSETKYSQLQLGNTNDFDFFPGASVYLMGATSEGSYISKQGKIINTNRNFSSRYGSLFQTSFDRVTNLSGSPVWNEKNMVIGMHLIASETTSYELRIDYVSNILNQLKHSHGDSLTSVNNFSDLSHNIQRGDIGISIDLTILGTAKSNYKLNSKIADEISAVLSKTGGPPEIMIISTVFPNSPADGILRSGDIIYKINDKIIGNNFLLIDEILNKFVYKEVNITVSRNAQILDLKIKKVDNTQDYKIKKYVSFAGGYLHEITNLVRYFLFIDIKGVYLSYTINGSPFSAVSSHNQENKNNFILTAINSSPIKNLQDFINFFKNNCDLESVYVEGIDMNSFPSKLTTSTLDMDFSNSLLQVSTYNEDKYKWNIESLDLKKYCSSRKDNNENHTPTINGNFTLNSTTSSSRKNKINKRTLSDSNEYLNEFYQANIKSEKDFVQKSTKDLIKIEIKSIDKNKSEIEQFNFLETRNEIKSQNRGTNNALKNNSKNKLKNLTNLKHNSEKHSVSKTINVSIHGLPIGLNKNSEPPKEKYKDNKKNIFDHLIGLHKFRI